MSEVSQQAADIRYLVHSCTQTWGRADVVCGTKEEQEQVCCCKQSRYAPLHALVVECQTCSNSLCFCSCECVAWYASGALLPYCVPSQSLPVGQVRVCLL